MSYRCTNAFISGPNVYGGGAVVTDDDPILKTHAAHFVKVSEPPAVVGSETASADAPRTPAPAKKVPAKKAAPAKVEPRQQEPVQPSPDSTTKKETL
ncbi:hypothetical protein [Mycobacterium sp. SMC-13]|uniref:hypothetical protein n=1 Tax=Mycobacterium sp. SMC-13 TaxID=3381626 RepID=UPI0038778DF5